MGAIVGGNLLIRWESENHPPDQAVEIYQTQAIQVQYLQCHNLQSQIQSAGLASLILFYNTSMVNFSFKAYTQKTQVFTFLQGK